MKDFRNLEPEELAADSSFQEWKIGNNPEATAFWTEWLRDNPDQHERVEKAAYLLRVIYNQLDHQFSEQSSLSNQEIQHEISTLYTRLNSPKPRIINWLRFTPTQYGIAASLLLLLGVFGWFSLPSAPDNPEITYEQLVTHVKSPLVQVANTTQKPMVINLPDRSTIVLYPRSEISYAKAFTGVKREVYLLGEAFFEVSKNPSRPFYVYANGLVTKVLGTSFMVQTNDITRQVKVVVKTGKVSVYAQNRLTDTNQQEDYKLGGTVLTPNQQVVFSAEDTRMVRSIVKEPTLLEQDVQKQRFVFKRTPMAEVFSTLEKAYSIKIIFDEETMNECYLTASLADEPLFDKLDLICHTINAHYEQLDTYIVIDSKGCK